MKNTPDNMHTKKIISDINKAFKKDDAFDMTFEKEMLMYRFLSEVDKICDDKKISKKELASRIGTSPSYITQIFRGSKTVNLEMLVKFQKALDFKYEISINVNNHNSIENWQNVIPLFDTLRESKAQNFGQIELIKPDYGVNLSTEAKEISLVA